MDERLRASYGRYMVGKRKAIVEPALGNLLHHNGMKKVYARGIQAANKHVMLVSMAMNLKKWLKHNIKSPKAMAHKGIITPWGRDALDFKPIFSFVELIIAELLQKLAPESVNLPTATIL